MTDYFLLDSSSDDEQSLPSTIAKNILRKIFIGDLKVGSRITEASIAEQLNISNIPVREAFSILQNTGVIEKIPHKGVRIREITEKEIRDYEVALIILYKNCIDLARPKWSSEKLEKMKSALKELKQELDNGNLIEYVYKYDSICRYVISVSENTAMLRFYTEITYITSAYCQSNWDDPDEFQKKYDLLVKMVEALCKGTDEEAKYYCEEIIHAFLKTSK